MKIRSVFFMFLLTALSLFTACGNDEEDHTIWDIYPIEFRIYVQDDAGCDLLNPENEDNILKQDIRAIYEQKEYK